jgi:prepilin-type N-terminal cleavage/methylation domain-containing protein
MKHHGGDQTKMAECCCHKSCKTERGFSLLEFAIVTLVSGILLTAGLKAYQLYLKNERRVEIREKLDGLSASFSNFRASGAEGRLPCPADPTLGVQDPNFGIEDCSLFTSGAAMGSCTQAGGQGVCIVAGRGGQPVLIGSVPFKTMRNRFDTDALADDADSISISYDDAGFEMVADPWDFQMTYAVTGILTDPATFDDQGGAIFVQTELGVDLSDPAGSAHYVVVSHGDNSLGAYSLEGNVAFACNAGATEGENCDGDANFVSGLRSEQIGANYYDDEMYYSAFSVSNIWEFSEQPGDIYSVNAGNVGVGVSDPLQKLHVADIMKVDEILLEEWCDTGGTNCWVPYAELECPAASAGNVSVATGFVGGNIVCTEVPIPSVISNQSCTVPGEFLLGVRTDGSIICGTP